MDQASENTEPQPTPGRERLRRPLMLLGLLVALGIAAYLYLAGGRFEETDDAYVQAAQLAISASIGGRVSEVDVHDNQFVHKGDLLFRLDDAPLRIAVADAAAQLAAARVKVEMLKATARQKQADLGAALATLSFAQTDAARQRRLASAGIAAQAQLDSATHGLAEASSAVASARQQLDAAVAALAGDPDIAPARHPDVQEAQARLDRARLDLSYAAVRAPGDGVVTRVEDLQVGSSISAAQPLFALVSAQHCWIDANFKEDQLTHVRPGERAKVTIDSYPGRSFNAHVVSVSPGTGSQFSVLPAENATGNWVKVVQRLPVRIELDRADAALPLRAGLSADVTVDTGHRRHLFGGASADAPR
jgi:membrane fusion protein (multidrug efflux system)